MVLSSTRTFLSGNTVIWELNGNQFEFTLDEVKEFARPVREQGLFAALNHARPALRQHFLAIFGPGSPEEEKELEYMLEQSFFDLQQKVDRL